MTEALNRVRETLQRTAGSLDARDFSDVRTPSAALVVGWLRATAAQTTLILAAHASGPAGAAAAAPNRRLVLELAMRTLWVAETGPEAVQIVEDARQQDLSALRDVMTNGWVEGNLPELLPDQREGYKGPSGSHLYRIRAWAEAHDADGLYLAWWTETDRSHASAALSDQYGRLSDGGWVPFPSTPRDELLASLLLSISGILTGAIEVLRKDGALMTGAALRKLGAELDSLLDDAAVRALLSGR